MSTEQNEQHGLLTVDEVASRLRLSRGTVYRKVREGTLPALRLGNNGHDAIRVDGRELDRWLYGDDEAA
jgi:excisionase family DNA binding protein